MSKTKNKMDTDSQSRKRVVDAPVEESSGHADPAGNEASSPPDAANVEQAPVDVAAPTHGDAADVEDVTPEQELAERAAECEQLKDQLLRVRADFDNYRKRLLRDMEQTRQTASMRLIQNLLPALDNLERALAHADADNSFVEGVTMVHKQFQDVLAAEGLAPIPALDEVFNPNVHDALATMPSETHESGRVIEEYERGYRLRDTIVRPARVIVSSGPPSESQEQNESNTPEAPANQNEEAPPSTP